MKSRMIRLGIVVVVAVTAVAFLSTLTSLAPAAHGAEIDNAHTVGAGDVNAEIRAARLISIPFGIASPLALDDDGSSIHVTGHGTCLAQGTFDIRVFVIQSATDGMAMGRIEGECSAGDPDEEWMWGADAETLVPAMQGFEAGEARACASAEVRSVDANGAVTTITKWWCKDVELEEGSSS